jgi:predicted RNA binding protein YcfA (HicA-like mRNA interferase family)
MRLPRDVSGIRLVNALRILGYETTRQSGSHVRLTTQEQGEHHVTIPKHDPLKIGTFASILDVVAEHHKISRSELLKRLKL